MQKSTFNIFCWRCSLTTEHFRKGVFDVKLYGQIKHGKLTLLQNDNNSGSIVTY